jgi:hypothetical protein
LFLPNGLISLFQRRRTVDVSVLAGAGIGEK